MRLARPLLIVRSLVHRRFPIVAGVQSVLLFWLAAILPTWVDEEYTLHTTARGIAYAWTQAIRFEAQAPLYFAVVALWREIDMSVFFARSFSVLCAILTVFLAAQIANRVWPGGPTRVFAACVALHPFIVYSATEIRLYAAGVTLAAGLWLTWYDGFFAQQPAQSKTVTRVTFVALAIAACWTQYFLGFLLVGFGAALLTRPRALRAYLVATAVVGVGVFPLVSIARSQAGTYHATFGILAGVKRALDPTLDFLFPHGWVSPNSHLAHGVYYAALLVFVALFVAGRARLDATVVAAWIVAASTAALFIVVVVGLRVEIVIPRHELALFVPLVVAAYATMARFTSRHARSIGVGIVVLFVCGAIAALTTTYRDFTKSGDAAAIAAYLDAHAGPTDAIAVFDGEEYLPLRRYLDVQRTIIAIPSAPSLETFSYAAFALQSAAQAEAVIGPDALHHRTLWVDQTTDCRLTIRDYGCAYLRDVLRRDYAIVERHTFFNMTLTRYRPR